MRRIISLFKSKKQLQIEQLETQLDKVFNFSTDLEYANLKLTQEIEVKNQQLAEQEKLIKGLQKVIRGQAEDIKNLRVQAAKNKKRAFKKK